MSEPVPPTSEKTVVVPNHSLGRLWTLTIVSLCLNGLILLFLLGAAFCHHPRGHHGFAGGPGWDGDRGGCPCQMGFGHRGHHFGGCFEGQCPLPPEGAPGMMGGPGDWHGHGQDAEMPGGPGMRGMMGGHFGPPDPAKMTDGILGFLSNKLTLTDDQKAKIKPLIEQQVAQMQKDMEAQRLAMQKKIEDAKAQIRPLLTPDQQKQLDALPLPGQKPEEKPAAPAKP